jgi:hypothetical protein
VGMYMASVTHNTFGACALKCRCTKSGGHAELRRAGAW